MIDEKPKPMNDESCFRNRDAYERAINKEEPMTFEEKCEKIRQLNAELNRVALTPISDKCCRTCDHFRNGQCAARNMAPIPEPVLTATYGCSKFYEKDFIPF